MTNNEFFYSCCARFSPSLEKLKKRTYREHVDFITKHIRQHPKDAAHAIGWALIGRIQESDPGPDRLGAWYLLDAAFRSEAAGPIANEVYRYIVNLINTRFEIGSDAMRERYEELFQSWNEIVEHSYYRQWGDAADFAKKAAPADPDLPFLREHPEAARHLWRMRRRWTADIALEVYERHGLDQGNAAAAEALSEQLRKEDRSIDAQEVTLSMELFTRVVYCTECFAEGHKKDNCAEQTHRTTAQKSIVNAEAARRQLAGHGVPWPQYVGRQGAAVDCAVRAQREGRLQTRADILHCMDVLRRSPMTAAFRRAFRDVVSIASASVLGPNTDPRAEKAVGVIVDHLGPTGGLAAISVKAIEFVRANNVYVATYARKSFAKEFEAHVEHLQIPTLTADEIRAHVAAANKCIGSVCERCLCGGHMGADCPTSAGFELTHDQRVALKILTAFMAPGVVPKWTAREWEDSISAKIFTVPFQGSQLRVAARVLTDEDDGAPHCTFCNVYGHALRRCHQNAVCLLPRHGLRMADVFFNEFLVRLTLKDSDLRSSERSALIDAVDLLEEGDVFPKCFAAAADVIFRLNVDLVDAQYYPQAVLDAADTRARTEPIDMAEVNYAIAVVGSPEFPKLCLTCGDMSHPIEKCKTPSLHMESVHRYAVELASLRRDLLERALGLDVTLATERLTPVVRACVLHLFTAVRDATPTVARMAHGVKSLERTRRALLVLQHQRIPRDDMRHSIRKIERFLDDLHKDDPEEAKVASDAVYYLSGRNHRVPICDRCEEAGHADSSCTFIRKRPQGGRARDPEREYDKLMIEAAYFAKFAPLKCVQKMDVAGGVWGHEAYTLTAAAISSAMGLLRRANIEAKDVLECPQLVLASLEGSGRDVVDAAMTVFMAAETADTLDTATSVLYVYGHVASYPLQQDGVLKAVQKADGKVFRNLGDARYCKAKYTHELTLCAKALRTLRRLDEDSPSKARKTNYD